MTTEPARDGFDPNRHSDTYEALARRCEQGAEDLEHEADNAAEILPTRAGGDRIDPQDWAEQKHAAAHAAREYAKGLRAEAGDRGPLARMDPDRLAQAEQVASAAQLGGILIDGRRMDKASAEGTWDFGGHAKKAWESGTSPGQVKAAQIEATGQFTHVAETIDGVEQVPFWRLSGPVDEATTQRTDRRVDEDEA